MLMIWQRPYVNVLKFVIAIIIEMSILTAYISAAIITFYNNSLNHKMLLGKAIIYSSPYFILSYLFE